MFSPVVDVSCALGSVFLPKGWGGSVGGGHSIVFEVGVGHGRECEREREGGRVVFFFLLRMDFAKRFATATVTILGHVICKLLW